MPENEPTAADRRAERNGWDAEERAYRISKGKALRCLYRHCKSTMPEHWNLMILGSRMIIEEAWSDCHTLDALLLENGEPTLFRSAFAVFHDDPAIQAIFRVAELRLLAPYHSKAPLYIEMRKKEGTPISKLWLHKFRELLKDGWTPEQCLQSFASRIAERASAGDARFAKDLADIIAEFERRPPENRRSLPKWIERGWITLRLYECPPDGADAFVRVRKAFDLMRFPFPSDLPRFELQFKRAWQNVRSRVFGNANPYFSQSAGAA